MKYVLLKNKNLITVGKLTKSRFLRGGARHRTAPKGRDGVRKFSLSCGAGRGGDGGRQNHAGWERRSHPSTLPRPIAIPIANHTCAKVLFTIYVI